MVTLILVWILNAVALLAVAYLLPGITVASFGSALIADPLLRVTEVDLHLMARRRFEADRRSLLCL